MDRGTISNQKRLQKTQELLLTEPDRVQLDKISIPLYGKLFSVIDFIRSFSIL